jgi:dynamin 1-like protein
MGVPYLIKTLNMNFIEHIKRCLPQIKENLQSLIIVREDELKVYGDFDKLDDPNSKGLKILSLISKFCQAFQELISR